PFDQVRSGGGLYNVRAAVILTRCTFVANELTGRFDGPGAILNIAGTMVLDSCALIGNRSAGDVGTIFNSGTMTLTNCTIAENHGRSTAAIGNQGTMTLTHCTVAGNVAEDPSGGHIITNFGRRRMTIVDSTINDNVAESPAILDNTSELVITGST